MTSRVSTMRSLLVPSAVLLLLPAVAANDDNFPAVMHGGGTTNPSKLFWKAMDLIEERARMPLHLTYRAIGSSNGQREFVGTSDTCTAPSPTCKALNHFGSGDIPMSATRFGYVTAGGRKMLHVPFAMGAIGVFHSVPTANLGGDPLDLNGCILAKIFSRQITTWDHPEITAINPKMTFTGPIKVVHRVHGSSSTTGFTKYLEATCPASWTGPGTGTGSTITWDPATNEAQGSGGMSSFIKDNVGAIGYIDAGHGHGKNLGEVKLQNKFGRYLTSKEADIGNAGTQALLAVPSVIPADPTSDFSAVNLLDLDGELTWPITMISYFYLDQDMSAYDAHSAALVMYFVKFILSAEGQQLATEFMFEPLPTKIKDYNTASLNTIQLPAGMPTFETETAAETLVRTGAGDFFISGKRKTFADVERESNKAAIAANTAALPLSPLARESNKDSDDETRAFARAGFALGIAGFLMGLVALINSFQKQRASKPRSVEIPARDISVPSTVSMTSAQPTKDAV